MKAGELLTPRVCEVYQVPFNEEVIVETVNPHTLISPQRIDVLIKLLYIRAKVTGLGLDFAQNAYKNHIHAITAFKDIENGQKEKNSLDVFISSFDELIQSFQNQGFDNTRSAIPVSSDNIILDGAHRLACSLYFEKEVSIIRLTHVGANFEIKPPVYDYKYFKRYLLETKYIDETARIFIDISERVLYLACLWPISDIEEKRKEALDLIEKNGSVVYSKTISPSFKLFDRLVAQVYMHDEWVGSIENNFSGSQGKSLVTYQKGKDATFVLFDGSSINDILELKDRIRDVFNIGKHSIHITDNTEQTKFLANIVFNNNSLLFLEHGDTYRNKEVIKRIYDSYRCGQLLNLDSARIIWGLSDYIPSHYEMKDDDLKIPHIVAEIYYNPDFYFNYLGMRAVMPIRDSVNKYILTENFEHLFEVGQSSPFLKDLRYRYKSNKILLRNKVRVFLSAHLGIFKIIKYIKRS